jgi:predicted dehydrogenase
MRIGVIGLDTSHAVLFTRTLHQPQQSPPFAGFRVVAAYPYGSQEIPSSASRIPGYRDQMEQMQVPLVDSVEELVEAVDAVFLETNDGRLHLQQLLPVLRAGKPVFVDKPVAANLTEVIAIYLLADHYNVPLFSSSALRYTPGVQQAAAGQMGEVQGCDTFSPCPLEPTHADLFWYGIHGVEMLCTVMGQGCEVVTRIHTPECDFVVGRWPGGRIGSYRGRRDSAGNPQSGFGGTVFGSRGIRPLGSFLGYEPLLEQILPFFKTGELPVTPEQTIEIYTWMQAADLSRSQLGRPVQLSEVLPAAQSSAEILVQKLLAGR